MKLIIFGRCTPPRWVWYSICPLNKKCAYKGNFCEIYDHLFKNFPLFLYRFKFSEAYISLNIDLGFIKVLSFLDFVDQTDHLWQIYSPPRWVWYNIYPINKKCAYKGNFCEIYDHLFKNTPLFLYRFKFSEAYISPKINLGPSLKFYHFLDFADQIEHLWQLYSLHQDGSLHHLSNKQRNVPTKLISLKCMVLMLKYSLLFLYRFKFSEAYIFT